MDARTKAVPTVRESGHALEFLKDAATQRRAGGGRARLFLLALFLLLVLPLPAQALEPVDLNRATFTELVALPGIGKHRAEEILRYRQEHGFRRTADLLRIKGIGRHTYLKLKPLVQVVPAAEPSR